MNLFQPHYALFVGIGVLIALLFPVTRHLRETNDRRQYYLLQAITLVGALVGAKLSVLFGDLEWPWVPVANWGTALKSGRSITGALLIGFLFAEISKPLLRYTLPPNDRFATVLPFSIAIGRVGCLLAGCCGGLPCAAWYCMSGADGIARYPTQILEIFFQVGVGLLFLVLVKRAALFGRLFSLYLILYGIFRFLSEYIRDTPKNFAGWSGYQWICIAMIVLGGIFFVKRTVAVPKVWEPFRIQKNQLELS